MPSFRSPTAARARRTVLASALGGDWRTAPASDPLGRPVTARWLLLPDGTAVVESAEAVGLGLLARRRARPARRVERGPRGAPGRACSRHARGGARVARRLGDGRRRRRAAVGAPRLAVVAFRSASRATCGTRCSATRGAARVFGPQKGASPEAVDVLERRLASDDEARGLPRPPGRRRGRRARSGARIARRRARRGSRARPRPDRLRRARPTALRSSSPARARSTRRRSRARRRAPCCARCARLGVPCVLFGGRVAARVRGAGAERRSCSGARGSRRARRELALEIVREREALRRACPCSRPSRRPRPRRGTRRRPSVPVLHVCARKNRNTPGFPAWFCVVPGA